jgi:hypothetical protein
MTFRLFTLTALMLILFSCHSPEPSGKETKSVPDTPCMNYKKCQQTPDNSDSGLVSFRKKITSIYTVIQKEGFDTLNEWGVNEVFCFNHHRILGIIIAKKVLQKGDYEKISHIYQAVLKNQSIRKPDSHDIELEYWTFSTPGDAEFWKTQIESCYRSNDNPLGEPLKEPYSVQMKGSGLIFCTARAEMWRSEMDNIAKAFGK